MGTGWFFNRDKSSFDNSWRGDESLEASDSLPDPDFLARKSSKTLKPPSNNSAKSSRMWEKKGTRTLFFSTYLPVSRRILRASESQRSC